MLQEFIDEFMEDLGRYEGTEGGSPRMEDSSKKTKPYGLDNPPIPRLEK